MQLGIISDCIHVKTKEGYAASEVHIFVRQMEALASHFSSVVICCPFKENEFKREVTAYKNNNISFVELPEVGGNSFFSKLKLFITIPAWVSAFKKIDKQTDIVYQRFPNNLNIPGFFYFYFKKKKVFATYTGTWQNVAKEPLSYSFQKWLLRKFFRGPIWVYSNEKKLAHNIFGGFSPSYSLNEWNEETIQVNSRIEKLRSNNISSLKLISVGALIDYKNQQYILDTCLQLKEKQIPFSLVIVGDGPLKTQYENFITENNLKDNIKMIGSLNFSQLRDLYRQNDFIVQAPLSEGFGKVPVEGFFHGLIPVINNVTMASYLTGNNERGYLFNASNKNSLFETLENIFFNPQNLHKLVLNGREFAKKLTLESWASEYFNKVISFFEKK